MTTGLNGTQHELPLTGGSTKPDAKSVSLAALSEVQSAALDRAVRLLSALPVQFKVVTADGKEYGGLVMAPPPKKESKQPKKRGCKHYPYGKMSSVIKPRLLAMAVGDVGQFPYSELPNLPQGRYQSMVTSLAGTLWGRGSYTSHRTDKHVELLRVM